MSRITKHTLGYAAAIALFALMAVTVIDVVGRYFFSRPLTGAFELTELLLSTVISLGLPLVTFDRAHISVDLIDSLLPHNRIRQLDRVMSFFSAAAFAALTYGVTVQAISSLHAQVQTDILSIPVSPFIFLDAAMSALMAWIFLWSGLVPGPDPQHHHHGGETQS
jgi:TRAP-type C4-dicarboxylate transport system permease small subunit